MVLVCGLPGLFFLTQERIKAICPVGPLAVASCLRLPTKRRLAGNRYTKSCLDFAPADFTPEIQVSAITKAGWGRIAGISPFLSKCGNVWQVKECVDTVAVAGCLPRKDCHQVRYSLACERFLRSTWHGERRIPPRYQARNAECLSSHANQRRSDRHPTLLRNR